jgi:hypothetical protein
MAPDYSFEIKEAYTFAEVQEIILEATQNIKTHAMKTLFINKLAPDYKGYVPSQGPGTLDTADTITTITCENKKWPDINCSSSRILL